MIFWLIPFAQVRFIIDFFHCPLAGQQFFNICELFILCSYSFHFFGSAVTVSKFSELLSHAATVFFPELILHKYILWKGKSQIHVVHGKIQISDVITGICTEFSEALFEAVVDSS